jgi:glycosyltransferase involved in cell wall biosynthesis
MEAAPLSRIEGPRYSGDRPRIGLAMEYPFMQQGGTEVLVRELVRGLSEHYAITLATGDPSIDALPPEYAKLIVNHIHWSTASGGSEAYSLARALAKSDIEFAHFHFGGTYMWNSNKYWKCPIPYLSKLGTPCLSTNHLAMEWLNCGCDPARPIWQKTLIQMRAWLSRLVVFKALRFEIAVSKHDEARLVRMFPMFQRKIIQRYHSLLREGEPLPRAASREPLVLCVGTIGGRKAQRILVEAFAMIAARHPEWQLKLVGRVDIPEDEHKIRGIIADARLQARIQLAGRLSDEHTTVLMKTASIFAMPSLQEGLGLSLQEALFHGCVAIGSKVGGIPELIDHESNGLTVPPGNPGALASALESLISHPARLEQMRQQARLSVLRKSMTAECMVENYVQLYRKLMSGRPKNTASR